MKKPKNLYIDKIFRLRLSSEVMKWILEDMGTDHKGNCYGDRNIPSRATEFFHWYSVYRKGFLMNLIENHYQEIKHLVRMIGRVRKEHS